MYKKLLVLFLRLGLVFISLLSIMPLFHQGFFSMHDNTQVARVIEMAKALREGQFPVRVVGDLGYGYTYPLFNFYAPFAYYIGGLFYLVGANALLATKCMIGLAILLSGVGMYLFIRSLAGEVAGIVGGLFYVFAPYHALDLYVRGDIGELFAYAALPFIFWGLWKSHTQQKWRYVIITSVSLGGMVSSHNLTALMAMPFILCFSVVLCIVSVRSKRLQSIFYQIIPLVLGLGLSTFYFIPALLEMKYTNVLSQIGGKASPLYHFVCIAQFWYSPWGYGGSAPGCIDGLSFMLGKVEIMLLALCVAVLPFVFFKSKKLFVLLLSGLAASFFCLFLTTSYSQFIWKAIPAMNFLQYPWRFLLLFSFFSSISISLLFAAIKRYTNSTIAAALSFVAIALLVFFNLKLFVPQQYLLMSASSYEQKKYLEFTASRISDEYMPKGFIKPKSVHELPQTIFASRSDVTIRLLHATVVDKQVSAQALYDVRGEWPIAYFPAWHFFMDGQAIPFLATSHGVYIVIKPGLHIYSARFISTDGEMVSNYLSLASIVALLLGIIYARKHKI